MGGTCAVKMVVEPSRWSLHRRRRGLGPPPHRQHRRRVVAERGVVAEQALDNGTWRRFFGGGEATGSRWRGSDFSGQQSGGPHIHVAFFTRWRRRSLGDSLRRQGAHRRATVGPCRPKGAFAPIELRSGGSVGDWWRRGVSGVGGVRWWQWQWQCCCVGSWISVGWR
jgi:hypothetical protein